MIDYLKGEIERSERKIKAIRQELREFRKEVREIKKEIQWAKDFERRYQKLSKELNSMKVDRLDIRTYGAFTKTQIKVYYKNKQKWTVSGPLADMYLDEMAANGGIG